MEKNYIIRGIVSAITFLVCCAAISHAAIKLNEPASISSLVFSFLIVLIMVLSDLHKSVGEESFLWRIGTTSFVNIVSFLIICDVAIKLNSTLVLWALAFPMFITGVLMFSFNEK